MNWVQSLVVALIVSIAPAIRAWIAWKALKLDKERQAWLNRPR